MSASEKPIDTCGGVWQVGIHVPCLCTLSVVSFLRQAIYKEKGIVWAPGFGGTRVWHQHCGANMCLTFAEGIVTENQCKKMRG